MVSLGLEGRHQQAQVTWLENRSGGRSQRNQTGRTQVEGWKNTKGKQDRRGGTRQGRGDIRQGRKKIIVMMRSKGGEIRQKEGKHWRGREKSDEKEESEMEEIGRGKRRNQAEGRRN